MENILKHNFHDNIIKNVHINSVVDFMDEIVIFLLITAMNIVCNVQDVYIVRFLEMVGV